MRMLVTGGAGFIGSALVRYLVDELEYETLNIDKLTYAGNLDSLSKIKNKSLHRFHQLDICNLNELKNIVSSYKPDKIFHLAAETHVDRSIDGPIDFINTNIIGTYNMLEAALEYFKSLPSAKKDSFLFLNVSTDEVFGELDNNPSNVFTELTSYSPNSPYSASKASADHMVNAWNKTFQLPTITTNCSNNYGPFHFPEKLIPLSIINALAGKSINIYGHGNQIRDWLFVEDHVKALYKIATEGAVGEKYNIGGNNEKQNIEVVSEICDFLDQSNIKKPTSIHSFKELITFVSDRPGHDFRYAIDSSKLTKDLGWMPQETFNSGLKKTINWFIDNKWWWEPIVASRYSGERLGTKE